MNNTNLKYALRHLDEIVNSDPKLHCPETPESGHAVCG